MTDRSAPPPHAETRPATHSAAEAKRAIRVQNGMPVLSGKEPPSWLEGSHGLARTGLEQVSQDASQVWRQLWTADIIVLRSAQPARSWRPIDAMLKGYSELVEPGISEDCRPWCPDFMIPAQLARPVVWERKN